MGGKGRIYKPHDLSGERGLILAVIAQAVNDLMSKKTKLQASAIRYFDGPAYREHLEWLDLDPDLLPEVLEGEGVKSLH